MTVLKGKRVIVGVTGSIAAFKAAGLVSLLVREGASVKAVMTEAAGRFVTNLTFQTLSGHPVYRDMFPDDYQPEIEHIALAEWADLVLVCPATANTIAKVAAGLADNLLAATILTTTKPVVFVPAMNTGMWENKVFQQKVAELKKVGYRFFGPAAGRLACGKTGKGRMLEPEEVMTQLKRLKF